MHNSGEPDDRRAEEILRGRSYVLDGADRDLAEIVSVLRRQAEMPAHPDAELRRVFAEGMNEPTGAPRPSPRAVGLGRFRWRRLQRVSRPVLARAAALSLAAKVGLAGSAVAASALGGAGAVGVLPGQTTDAPPAEISRDGGQEDVPGRPEEQPARDSADSSEPSTQVRDERTDRADVEHEPSGAGTVPEERVGQHLDPESVPGPPGHEDVPGELLEPTPVPHPVGERDTVRGKVGDLTHDASSAGEDVAEDARDVLEDSSGTEQGITDDVEDQLGDGASSAPGDDTPAPKGGDGESEIPHGDGEIPDGDLDGNVRSEDGGPVPEVSESLEESNGTRGEAPALPDGAES